jgi:putative endonuclease
MVRAWRFRAPRREVLNLGYYTYIMFSEKLNKYYAGHTENLTKRLVEHNSGKSKFTKAGIPWEIEKVFYFHKKAEAIMLELEIKKRGCERYLKSLEK